MQQQQQEQHQKQIVLNNNNKCIRTIKENMRIIPLCTSVCALHKAENREQYL